jgi:hypothetical protein
MMDGKELAIVAVFCVAIVGMLLRPFAVAWARRLSTGPANTDLVAEVDELRHRVIELEADRGRTLELEERLDFAERMLAQRSQPRELERMDTPV